MALLSSAASRQQDEQLLEGLRRHGLLPLLLPDAARAARDFGGVRHGHPAALLRPASPDDVRRCVVFALSTPILTLTPRGNGHSVNGQSVAGPSGISLDLSAFSSITLDSSSSVWAGGGTLWEDVLHHCLRQAGRAPPSWTDYLRLSVGGTLSSGGVGGQCFRHGPMACNVEEMEVVTAAGEIVICSASHHSDLFHAVLGGLGQFGVIIRARIPLRPAPSMVRWVRTIYSTFQDYTDDAESLVGKPDHDYLEGFAFVNSPDPVNGWPIVPILPHQTFDPTRIPPGSGSGSGSVLYCLELALYYSNDTTLDEVDMRAEDMLRGLRHVRGLEFSADVTFESFLTRVNSAEAAARANGTWDAPHPWLNLLVSADDVADFDRVVFKEMLRDGIGGPMLVYPLLKSKWNADTSLVVPNADVFYLIGLLRYARPLSDDRWIEDAEAQNAEIVDCCVANGYDFKVYLPSYKEESQWKAHFASKWAAFEERKARYDPFGIMCPGQGIFPRKAHGPMTIQ